MASPIFYISNFTLLILLISLRLSSALNVTELLSIHPDFSDFTALLSASPVAADLSGLSSVTLLVVPNAALRRSSAGIPLSSASVAADVLRYHVLLRYLSLPELRRIPASGEIVTTLYQTTGRAAAGGGAVNLTISSSNGTVTVRSPVPFSLTPNATVLASVAAVPYNLSILAVDSLLVPYGTDLAASEGGVAAPPLAPQVNVTRILSEVGKGFNVMASMLAASGVAEEFEGDEMGAGITVFAPADAAFADLPTETAGLRSLPAEEKAAVLRFHVLHSYYPLGSLESIVNPVQPTLQTERAGAGRFTLNITRVNGSVAIDTGMVQATITQTVFDQNPVAIFGVSKVLLPKEMFEAPSSPTENAEATMAPMPEPAMSPEDGSVETPPSRLSSPPGLRGVGSDGGDGREGRWMALAICIALYLTCIV
ncbi:Fasciclin-like arabinogalactan protein 4 [Acorus gramineus]|uniref:Fasciclin-like arabinogalactan protein 4 n=1 Tax=Acorus gramineus TaxID=55184 RepID=A0AAV9AN52_ACOGR|nr:Fasciclin-like arabinogalactan protein 4 [Acorus gramineus]